MTRSSPRREVVRVGRALHALDLRQVSLDERREREEAVVDHAHSEVELVEQLRRPQPAQDRELHDEARPRRLRAGTARARGGGRRGSGPSSRAGDGRSAPRRGRPASGTGSPRRRRSGAPARTCRGRPLSRTRAPRRRCGTRSRACSPRPTRWMSIASTCSAPFSASCTERTPLPEPTSRQRLPAPSPVRKTCFQTSRLPRVGTKTSGSNVSSGNLQRVQAAAVRRRATGRGRSAAEPTSAGGSATLGGRPGFVPASRSRTAATCAGDVPQQPPMIWAPSSRQPAASSAYSCGPMRSSNLQPQSEK